MKPGAKKYLQLSCPVTLHRLQEVNIWCRKLLVSGRKSKAAREAPTWQQSVRSRCTGAELGVVLANALHAVCLDLDLLACSQSGHQDVSVHGGDAACEKRPGKVNALH